MARRRARLKPEDILWPVTERTVEAINHNFDILFRDLGLFDSILPVSLGGTGTTAFDRGDVVVALTDTQLGGLAAVATGFALISQGANVVPAWGKIGLTTHVSGILPIGNGGTNASDKTAAFDNLSPLATKGDLLTHDGTNNVRLPVGPDNHMLVADSGQTEGVKWTPFLTSALLELFLYADADDVVATYLQALLDKPTGADEHLTFGAFAAGTHLCEEWISDALGYNFIPDGVAHMHLHVHKHSGTKALRCYAELYHRTAGGVETLIGTTALSELLPTDDAFTQDLTAVVSETDIDEADYVVAKLYAVVSGGGSDPVLGVHIEGTTFSRLELPVPGGVGGGGPHNILSATVHSDAETNNVVRGALIIGASLPFNGQFFWLDGQPMAEIDSGVDYSAQQYWEDGAAPGALGFTDPNLIRWRRLPPAAGTLRSNGIDTYWDADTVTQPKVKVFRSNNLNIADGAGVLDFGGHTVEMEDSEFDSHAFWNAGVNPERLTVPAGSAGIYLIVGQGSWASSAAGRKAVWIFKNGVRVAIAEVNGDDDGLGLSFTVSTFVQLAVNDYVELVVRQDSGGALDLLGAADASYTQIQMVRVAL